jgi:hypothetical protein
MGKRKTAGTGAKILGSYFATYCLVTLGQVLAESTVLLPGVTWCGTKALTL